jgi:hypothetical protein
MAFIPKITAIVCNNYNRAANVITFTDPNHLVDAELRNTSNSSWTLGMVQIPELGTLLSRICFDKAG